MCILCELSNHAAKVHAKNKPKETPEETSERLVRLHTRTIAVMTEVGNLVLLMAAARNSVRAVGKITGLVREDYEACMAVARLIINDVVTMICVEAGLITKDEYGDDKAAKSDATKEAEEKAARDEWNMLDRITVAALRAILHEVAIECDKKLGATTPSWVLKFEPELIDAHKMT